MFGVCEDFEVQILSGEETDGRDEVRWMTVMMTTRPAPDAMGQWADRGRRGVWIADG
ncbi:MAG: hypothetical protein R3F19_09330 [Verrucomicrobiales bacterium]